MATLGQYDLEDMTAQEVFEASAVHLLNQSEKSENQEGLCVYKGEGGLSCAAGIFVKDYEKEMEGFCGTPWGEMIKDHNQSKKHYSLVVDLQNIHDDKPVPDWLCKLKSLGTREKLGIDFLRNWFWDDEAERYREIEVDLRQ